MSTSAGFDYHSHFHGKIQEHKDAKTYKVLGKVNRDASGYPYADEHSDGEKRIVVWCSNDVLGLSSHPLVKKAVNSRVMSGSSLLHSELEKELAEFHGKEAAFISTSGYLSTVSALGILGKLLPECQMYSAVDNHASQIDGISRSRVPKFIFRTGDVQHLDELLSQSEFSKPKIVVVESVYSMTGMITPLDEICKVSHRHGALVYVDEVHAVGLYGATGAGIAEVLDCRDQIDLILGSLGKTFGNVGAYIAGSHTLVDFIRHHAPGFVFTTAIPPMSLAGSLTALHIVLSEEGQTLRKKLHENVAILKNLMREAGIPIIPNESHIILVSVRDPGLCTKIADELLRRSGHYIIGATFPIVAKGDERLRVTPSPFHTEDMMLSLVKSLGELWKEFGIPNVSKQ